MYFLGGFTGTCLGHGGMFEPEEAVQIKTIMRHRLTASGSQTAPIDFKKARQGSQVAIAKGLTKDQESELIRSRIKENL
jgi:hypothetical protein